MKKKKRNKIKKIKNCFPGNHRSALLSAIINAYLNSYQCASFFAVEEGGLGGAREYSNKTQPAFKLKFKNL